MEKFVPYDFFVVEVIAPPSKSYAQRAIFAATLCTEETLILNPGDSDDVDQAITVCYNLGGDCRTEDDQIRIFPNARPLSGKFNCGESGLGVRITTSLAAVLCEHAEIDGIGSLKQRPMTEFEKILPQIGIECQTNNGFLPLRLSGQAKGGNILLDGRVSSQYLTGLLLALPLLNEDSNIHVKDLKSKPYVDMTLKVLSDFGIEIINENYDFFHIPWNQQYKSPGTYSVEGDWSGAAFWIVYGSLRNGITIQGLNQNSFQADKAILDVLKMAGVQYSWHYDKLIISAGQLQPFTFDATDCPDLFPALVVLAAGCYGISKIKGVHRLKHKESDRAAVLQEEFGRLGLRIDIRGDEMEIDGTGKLSSGEIHAHNDHRIAMAGAIGAVLTDEGINIENAECVAKSYPGFWSFLG